MAACGYRNTRQDQQSRKRMLVFFKRNGRTTLEIRKIKESGYCLSTNSIPPQAHTSQPLTRTLDKHKRVMVVDIDMYTVSSMYV